MGCVVNAHYAGEDPIHNHFVCPQKILGLTWLDVRAVPSVVAWVGDPKQRPVLLQGTDDVVSYIGQNSEHLIVLSRTSRAPVRLPVADVAVEEAAACG